MNHSGIGGYISVAAWAVLGLVILINPGFLWKVEELFLKKRKDNERKEPTPAMLWLIRFCGLILLGFAGYAALNG